MRAARACVRVRVRVLSVLQQGRENTSSSLLWDATIRSLYPGESGFHSETGGKMANLRALSYETVRKYHADFYRPDNLCVIVAGQLGNFFVFRFSVLGFRFSVSVFGQTDEIAEAEDFLKVLSDYEQRILSKPALPQSTLHR
jgi:hypothetical protein